MRTYPRNSPEAAARIVALLIVADGHVCQSEIDVLKRIEFESRLGLPVGGFASVVQTLCEDMWASTCRGNALCSLDAETLRGLMAELDDRTLQRTVLAVANAAAQADNHIAEAEEILLEAAHRHWRLPPHTGVAALAWPVLRQSSPAMS